MVTGNAFGSMIWNSEIDSHSDFPSCLTAMTFTEKKAGKVSTTGRIVVAADGKSRRVTTTGTNPQGQKFNTTAVYDRQ